MAKSLEREVHKLLHYTEEEKMEIRKELGLTEDIIANEIQAITEWFDKQPHLVDAGIEPEIVETMLIISKGSREKAKRKIEALYRGKAMYSEIFEGRELFLNKEFMNWFRVVLMSELHNLERICMMQIEDPDPNIFCLMDIIKLCFMIADFRMKYDYIIGDRWIIDLNNISVISIMPKLNPLLLHRAASVFQEGMGQKILSIHIINAPQSVQSIVNLLKRFIKPKIIDRIIIHDKLDDLYEYVEKDYLPKDYGGNQKSVSELAEIWHTEFRRDEMRKYLDDAIYKKSDENKRPGGTAIDPLAGSFKKLDLD